MSTTQQLESAFRAAETALREAGRALRNAPEGTPEWTVANAVLTAAFDAFEVAADNLREGRDGYRYTFPIGACKACGRLGHGCAH